MTSSKFQPTTLSRIVLLYMTCTWPTASAVGQADIFCCDFCSVRQQSAGDDAIVGCYVVVTGRELDAIVHRSDHLVIVNAVEGRRLLHGVAGAALRLDPAARIGILCRYRDRRPGYRCRGFPEARSRSRLNDRGRYYRRPGFGRDNSPPHSNPRRSGHRLHAIELDKVGRAQLEPSPGR